MDRSQKFSVIAGRAAELLLAVVFLAGAVLKAIDVDLFVVQISYYHVVERQFLLTVSALGTLWIETALGIALLLRLRLRGLTFAAVLGILAVFTGLIAYAWAFYDLKDCGCFGAIEMSPRVSIAKNVFLVLCCGAAWWGCRRAVAPKGLHPLVSVAVKMLACVVAAAAVVAYAYSNMEIVDNDTPRPFAQFVFEADGVQWDLGQGEYFVPVLSMVCEDCMASVTTINDLALESDFPPIVALCYEDNKGDLDAFRQTTGAVFPLYSLGDRVRTFYELVDPEPPRFYLIRDGASLQYWDEKPPEASVVRDLLAQPIPRP